MSIHVRLLAGVVPAHAGTTWGSPQEVSSKLGRSISLSTDGTVAAWIRTNRSSGSGPVRTAYYKSAKKGWTPSAPIAGTSGITNLQLSPDGNTAFAEAPGTGYVMAQRTSGNTWGTAATVVSGTQLAYGQMSSDTNTIVYVDWAGASDYPTEIPGKLKVQTRAPGGAWAAPATLSDVSYGFYYDDVAPVALSGDGSTVAWFDATYGLKVSTKLADGTWGAPVLIKQYPSDPGIGRLQFSTTGATLIWTVRSEEGVLVTTRGTTGWSPVGYVTTDDVTEAAVAPNGTIVAYSNTDRQVTLRTWNGVKWAKPTVLGSASTPALVLTNKTLAWTSTVYSGSTLRVSIYAKGKWQPSTKRSSAAQSPALTPNGRTLAWGATSNKRIYSAKR